MYPRVRVDNDVIQSCIAFAERHIGEVPYTQARNMLWCLMQAWYATDPAELVAFSVQDCLDAVGDDEERKAAVLDFVMAHIMPFTGSQNLHQCRDTLCFFKGDGSAIVHSAVIRNVQDTMHLWGFPGLTHTHLRDYGLRNLHVGSEEAPAVKPKVSVITKSVGQGPYQDQPQDRFGFAPGPQGGGAGGVATVHFDPLPDEEEEEDDDEDAPPRTLKDDIRDLQRCFYADAADEDDDRLRWVYGRIAAQLGDLLTR